MPQRSLTNPKQITISNQGQIHIHWRLTMAKCPSCGTSGEYDYCAYCGRELVADEPSKPKTYYSPTVTAREAEAHRQALNDTYPPSEDTPHMEPEPSKGEWKLAVGVA